MGRYLDVNYALPLHINSLHSQWSLLFPLWLNSTERHIRKQGIFWPPRSIMFSWGCSLSCCDLSHVELMGSCHKSATLSEMKAERSAHTHTRAHTHIRALTQSLSFLFFPLFHPKCWQDGSRLWSDTLRPEWKACGVTESSAEQFFFCLC